MPLFGKEMIVFSLIIWARCVPIFLDPSRPIPERIQDLLDNMTLEEKVGQFIQINCAWNMGKFLSKKVGAVLLCMDDLASKAINLTKQTRLKIPVLNGIDAVHGHATWSGATVFPMPIAASCSWDEELLEMEGNITAFEIRYTGPHWSFAPILCIGRELRWGRIHETLGEDPYLISRLGTAVIQGLQGRDGVTNNPDKVMACAKHYVGYSETQGGVDSSESENSWRKLRSFFLPCFEAAARKGKCGSMMTAHTSIDGTPVTVSPSLIRDVLKKEWDWPGFVLTDWGNVGELISESYIASNMEEASVLTVKAGVDMIMESDDFYEATLSALSQGKLNESLIDESVRLILDAKFKLGLFEDPRYPDMEKAKSRNSSPFSRSQAQKLAEESLVLVKNDGLLPLDRTSLKKIAVVGPNADHVVQQLGDWTHGQPRNHTITIVDGFKEAFSNVEYQKGCGIEKGEKADLGPAIDAVNSADVSIVVVGDRHAFNGEFHSTATLELQGGQNELLDAVIATNKKFVLVVLASKPLVIPQHVVSAASAIFWQFCPGNMGGRALARAVFGDVNPSGRLSISIPRHVGQQPCFYYRFRCQHGSYADFPQDPAWVFGYGLGYSKIEYLSAKLDKNTYSLGENIRVSIAIKNSGKYDADEVVQIYVADILTSVTWVGHQLKGFKRQHVKAGETVETEIIIPVNDLWLINAQRERVVEPGAFDIHVAKAHNDVVFHLGLTVV
jgi:beta-glucosidase